MKSIPPLDTDAHSEVLKLNEEMQPAVTGRDSSELSASLAFHGRLGFERIGSLLSTDGRHVAPAQKSLPS